MTMKERLGASLTYNALQYCIIGQYNLQTADCRLQTMYKMQNRYKLQTEIADQSCHTVMKFNYITSSFAVHCQCMLMYKLCMLYIKRFRMIFKIFSSENYCKI